MGCLRCAKGHKCDQHDVGMDKRNGKRFGNTRGVVSGSGVYRRQKARRELELKNNPILLEG